MSHTWQESMTLLVTTFGVNCYFLGPTIFAIIVYFSISCLVCVSKAELHVNLELATQCTVNQVNMSSSRTHRNAHSTYTFHTSSTGGLASQVQDSKILLQSLTTNNGLMVMSTHPHELKRKSLMRIYR